MSDWESLISYLRETDPALLGRISRRMINHMCWRGIADAQPLLQRAAAGIQEEAALADNQPIQVRTGYAPVQETFAVAVRHFSPEEILRDLEKWIKDDKTGVLIEAVERQHRSLADIAHALRFQEQFAVRDRELSRAVRTGLRAALARRLLTDDVEFVNKAKRFVGIESYSQVLSHVVDAANSYGKLGGKASGLLLAQAIVRSAQEDADVLGEISVPKTWYLTSDAALAFFEYNELDDVQNRKYLDIEQIRREYPQIVHVFKHSEFPPELVEGLSSALDDFGESPLIVRSSSLLEDRIGSSFSGKYKSLFLANQGPKRERLAALLDAIAEVYASVFGPDPIEYRAARGLLDFYEEMAIMIQEVVGSRVGPYFFPAYAGVAFSRNEFRWSPRIRREDGLLRLVPGLGTRAVDRVGDDYPVLIAPGQPGLRVNVTREEIERYSPKKVDVINLQTRQFETVMAGELIARFGDEYPIVRKIVSVMDEGGVLRPPPFGWNPEHATAVVTFEGLVRDPRFLAKMRALLRLLSEKLEMPVDIEFAGDGDRFYLLQCRPQSSSGAEMAVTIPQEVPPERVLFQTSRYVSNGVVPDLTHIVYVDPDGYQSLATRAELIDVGRAVGKLNKLLPKRRFVLIGPGRWGSRGDIRLGVQVTYSDINNAAMLIEVAARRGSYVPELSFGTHFFQDLVESEIRYLPIFPSDEHTTFDMEFLRRKPSVLPEMLPQYSQLASALRVIDVGEATGGLLLRVLMNADAEQALGMFDEPQGAPLAQGAGTRSRIASAAPPSYSSDEHSRWRMRMVERIAEEADIDRFGIEGIYVFGSTRNGTAGPASDIDLLVHFAGTYDRRRALMDWLDGWSAALAEMNYLRTGHRAKRLLDIHIVTDDDIAKKRAFAAKIGAATDAARPLRVRGR
jgi:predicted nucleotidyltransferase